MQGFQGAFGGGSSVGGVRGPAGCVEALGASKGCSGTLEAVRGCKGCHSMYGIRGIMGVVFQGHWEWQ